jgi:hypothetical protein
MLSGAQLPMRLSQPVVTTGCKPAQQESRTKSTNIRAALTKGMSQRCSKHARFL